MAAIRIRSNRRVLLGGSTAAVAALTLPSVLAAAPANDRELIALLIAVERIQIDLYDAILETFDAAAFAAAGFAEAARTLLATVRDAEVTQREALDGDDPEMPVMAVSDELGDALREARELENLAVAAYAGVIPRIGRRGVVPELVGIQSVEARHSAWLSSLLGDDPFPEAIDSPLPPGEVLARLAEIAGLTPPAGTPVADADEMAGIVAAIAADLGVSSDAVAVIFVEPRDWPDTSLGCPEPGKLYAEVITPGYVVGIGIAAEDGADGEEFTFHTDLAGTVVRC